MKIVQLLPELNEGGVERGTIELSREFVKLGLESIVISNGGKQAEKIDIDGGKHIKFDVASKNIFTAPLRIYKLRKLLKGINPDVIHARSRVPAWLAYLANKTLHIPFVTTVHGLNSVNKYSEIMTKGDRVICVGEAVKDHIMSGYSLEYKKDKITVIQRGVDTELFNEKSVDTDFVTKFKKDFGLNGKFIVTSVGRITWLKDYETFIEAIAIAKKDIPNIVGVIVGGASANKNDYLESLKNLADKLNINEEIKFAGSQSNMPEVYYLSDILINASLKMGNVARTIVEALALNTPVIATTYEGLNNIIKNGLNGAIIETRNPRQLAEKIIEVKNHNYKNISHTIPAEYTLNTMVDSTLKVYKNLLDSRNSFV